MNNPIIIGKSTLHNCDCMEFLKATPDHFYELAIVDPPYGSAWGGLEDKPRSRFGGIFDKYKIERTGGTWSKKYQETNNIKHWDVAPEQEYFNELARVSKNQIIWGGNYFDLPPTRCFLIWKKLTISEKFTMAMCEYAWTSFNLNAKLFEHAPQGTAKDERFHPTQKPIKLYEWLLTNYAKQGDKILDTHLGSMSSVIACLNIGFEITGCELDVDYFNAGVKRVEQSQKQQRMFA